MKIVYSPHFVRSYNKAPVEIRAAFDKKSALLLQSLQHPSLHAKKYDESNDRWQARVNKDWRFYFTIERDAYIMKDIIRHPK